MAIPIAWIGREHSGKSEVLSALIADLKKKGYRIGVVKHLPHKDMKIDQAGRDTYEFRAQGAEKVIVSGAKKYAVFSEIEKEVPLGEILKSFKGYDFVFLVGYFTEHIPTIEVYRKEAGEMLGKTMKNLIAVYTNLDSVEESNEEKKGTLHFRPVSDLAKFIEQSFEIKKEYEDAL